MNTLYYGDCLAIMQDMQPDSIDLIYLDPPFNSNRDYSAIYRDATGQPLPEQVENFSDMWSLDSAREKSIRDMPVLMESAGIDGVYAEFWIAWAKALRETRPDMLAYLSYMVERLLPMRTILKSTGSIYLHCDPTASHYLKIMMDMIFGDRNFLNEVIWHYQKWTNAASHYQRNHDVLLIYAKKKKNHTFNKMYTEPAPSQAAVIKRGYNVNKVKEKDGAKLQLLVYNKEKVDSLVKLGKLKLEKYDRIVFRNEQKETALSDTWSIQYLHSQAKERLGYATQKPEALLERIIKASSNKGDIVLDPFCGCATTIAVAHKLERRWIGIDIAIHAVKRVARARLADRLGLVEGQDFTIKGIPGNMEGVQDLFDRDPYHFQKWAVEQVDGFVTTKRTADGGVDGRLYFFIPDEQELQRMVIEVKGGAHNIGHVRALRGVMDNTGALMAGFIVREELGDVQRRNYLAEMAAAGHIDVGGKSYPRMQLLTAAEILAGKRFETPTVMGKGSSSPALPFGNR